LNLVSTATCPLPVGVGGRNDRIGTRSPFPD
jgi:hypothetical protein